MKFSIFFLVGLLCFSWQHIPASAQVDSNKVVVWVHGLFAGQLGDPGFPYKSEFASRGFINHLALVGPVSSNWDRACELFAQIKGTVVDYGVCHSRKYGHSRFGKDFTGKGFYPEWSAQNRIHLVGHSMGGQTIRMLEILLQEGSGCPEDTSELFTGSGNWIRSLTSMSSPHDGASLVSLLGDGITDFLKNLIVGFSGATEDTFFEDIYSFELDHWGIVRQNGESFGQFWDRLQRTILSKDNKDFAPFDVSEEGARVQNNLGKQAYSGTNYMAFATERTNQRRACTFWFWCSYYEVADLAMNPLLYIPAGLIGGINTDDEKQKNDGVVNWINQLCPSSDASSRSNCKEFSGSWPSGKWFYVDVNNMDHGQIQFQNTVNDIFNYGRSTKKLYADHAARILALDSNAVNSFKESSTSVFSDYMVDMSKYDNKEEIENLETTEVATSVVMSLFAAVAAVLLVGGGYRRYKKRKSELNIAADDISEVEITEAQENTSRFSGIKRFFSRKMPVDGTDNNIETESGLNHYAEPGSRYDL